MCEDRERLIGYVYDECDSGERRTIEEHLGTCHECRKEIAGLRSVRQDLLAWGVPDHETVWRPAVDRVKSPWEAVPAWAMAAAAAVILMVGAAGGAATYALMPRGGVQAAQAAVSAEPARAVVPAAPSGLEQRLLTLERQNAALAERLAAMASRGTVPDFTVINSKADDLARRVNSMEDTLLGLYVENRDLRTNQRRNNYILSSLTSDQVVSLGVGGGQ